MMWFSLFFFLSGLCSIVYELVWLRLAMAKFGATTALVSIFLSLFMAGLGLGSWLAGILARRYGSRRKFSPLTIYASLELAIGVSAIVVPWELAYGSRFLERISGGTSISSASFYLLSGIWLAITLLPWCACMGATIPLGMDVVRRYHPGESRRSFSFLYVANVVGAVVGACMAPVLIELFGFRGTLRAGTLLNACIFFGALAAAMLLGAAREGAPFLPPLSRDSYAINDRFTLLLLFTTGLTTMASEVVWIRLYTVFIGPMVYSFALILATYLGATFVGCQVHRMRSRQNGSHESRLLWASLGFFGLLSLVTADPRLPMPWQGLRVVLGVAPFAGVIGFLTPMLVDRWSGGDPGLAGRAYAVNVAGCIVGPLVAAFVLLPVFGERVSVLILVVPWLAMALFVRREASFQQHASAAAAVIAAVTVFFFARTYDSLYRNAVVLRDSTATVLGAGESMNKMLLVNGVGMTVLGPITKMMAHMPLAQLQRPPRNVLILCFGMGTTFRSAMSWGAPVTVVELVPSVPKLFSFYHPGAGALLSSPRAHVVIDDARRFLERSAEKFDAIIIDPPPPIDTAGSGLLYSREFYQLAREHLRTGGIVQQWLFEGDDADKAAATRAMTEVFPYVRVYRGINAATGYHLLASMQPIPQRADNDLVAHMPPEAIADMMEWGPGRNPEEQFRLILSQEISPQALIAGSPATPALQDDRPINEYDWVRRALPKVVQPAAPRH